MQCKRNNLRARCNGKTRCQLVLRCCLMLAAWQGPIPWCHFHGTLVAQQAVESKTACAVECGACQADRGPGIQEPGIQEPDTQAIGFAVHLRTHHAAIDPFSEIDFGWHLHVDLPCSLCDAPLRSDPLQNDSSDRVPTAHDLPLVSDSTAMQSIASAFRMLNEFARLTCELQGRQILPLSPAARSELYPTHFLDDFASGLPLPMRLCVVLC